mmetsp:Transcript_31671/g.90000  ORF Transcript_31671/g.90000 Transcript_31671/m.90000 type:complete len:422 (-) Transcript_31671:192-1457(-)
MNQGAGWDLQPLEALFCEIAHPLQGVHENILAEWVFDSVTGSCIGLKAMALNRAPLGTASASAVAPIVVLPPVVGLSLLLVVERLDVPPGLKASGAGLDLIFVIAASRILDELAVLVHVATVCEMNAVAQNILPELALFENEVLKAYVGDALVLLFVNPLPDLLVGLPDTVVQVLVLELVSLPILFVVVSRQNLLPDDRGLGRVVLHGLDGPDDRIHDQVHGVIVVRLAIVDADRDPYQLGCKVGFPEDPVDQGNETAGCELSDAEVESSLVVVAVDILGTLAIVTPVTSDGVTQVHDPSLLPIAFRKAHLLLSVPPSVLHVVLLSFSDVGLFIEAGAALVGGLVAGPATFAVIVVIAVVVLTIATAIVIVLVVITLLDSQVNAFCCCPDITARRVDYPEEIFVACEEGGEAARLAVLSKK